ncbi:hypothetical protein [Pandoraea pnomenusa]|uniref:hypothetical protein n=1 Tax=Pandoraea pnomenusa TaxID=93220 RepID=UPI0033401134
MKEVLEKAFGESEILALAHVSRHGLSAMQQRVVSLAQRRPEIWRVSQPASNLPTIAAAHPLERLI